MDSRNGGLVRVPKAAELIAQRIRKSIVRGELKVGDYLPQEAQLLAAYEVSRPTLREAIRILEVEGLLSISRGARRGARVERPTTDIVTKAAGIALQFKRATLADVYEARTLIEPVAARQAAERRPGEAAAALRAQIEKECAAADANDVRSLRHELAVFHRVLMDQAQNVTLSMIAAALQDLIVRHERLVYSRVPERPPELEKQIGLGLRSRRRLVRYVEEGDGPGAEAHWSAHMRNTGRFWLGGVADTSVIDILD